MQNVFCDFFSYTGYILVGKQLFLLLGICWSTLCNRPLNSHGFTVCHTVSLPFSRSHGRFFISHGFTNFKWIFSQTHNFLRKQTRQHNLLSKNIVACLLHTKKYIILSSLIQRLPLGALLEMTVPRISKISTKNICQVSV